MRLPAHHGVRGPHAVRRELARLVLAVVVVDALFIAGYYVFRHALAAEAMKFGYTAAWTAVTLLIVLRGLVRLRAMRSRDAGHGRLSRG